MKWLGSDGNIFKLWSERKLLWLIIFFSKIDCLTETIVEEKACLSDETLKFGVRSQVAKLFSHCLTSRVGGSGPDIIVLIN